MNFPTHLYRARQTLFTVALLFILTALSLSWALTVLPTLAQDDLTTPPPPDETSAATSEATPEGTPGEEASATAPNVIFAPVPRPNPTSVISADGLSAELFFDVIKQGRAGLVRVTGDGSSDVNALTEVNGLFLNRVVPFFTLESEPGAFYGLLVPSMEQAARLYDLEIYGTLGDGDETSRVTLQTQVEVELGGFLGESVDLPTDRAYLVSAEVERAEFARLTAVFETVTPEKRWDDGFQKPINAELTSRFGTVRTLNGTFPTRHTGWDLRAATGTPVHASASGRVAFAGVLDIRGNCVIIDHGYGVFSTYSHFSQVFVTRGQEIARDEIIGLTGNTGRSSGPHLHWEIAVNGEFVDSADFIGMWLP